jgi:F0F1-type ATP synthase epsilon subunit
MANPEDKTFQCSLIDPTGKLLDCRATSVVLPAHDGQLGILYDHMPMLCQLGLGIMKVTPAQLTPGGGGPADRVGQPPSADGSLFFFLDGGCALVAQNTVTVIAYDALALQDVKAEKIASLIEKTAQNAANPALPALERTHESQRLRALQKLAETRGRTME